MKVNRLIISRAINIIIGLAAISFIGQIAIKNFQNEGEKIPKTPLVSYQTGEHFQLPDDRRVALFFWATWCAPCKVEMMRIKKSVEQKKISPDQILAINPFEDSKAIQDFLEKNDYPFHFVDDQRRITNFLEIDRTPTITWLDHGLIEKHSSGLSLVGIFTLERFLKKTP